MTDRVEDVKGCLVNGEVYNVPCFERKVISRLTMIETTRVMPVIGPVHDDEDIIGFAPKHIHYDYRFMSKYNRKIVQFEQLEFYAMPSRLELIVVIHPNVLNSIKRMDMICIDAKFGIDGYPQTDFTEKLSNHYKDATVKCGRCPHRGFPLSSLPRLPGEGERVICPGHGLVWDLKTGKQSRV